MGSIRGAILGAVVLSVAPEVLRDVSEYRMIIFGLIMMIVMLVRPQGIMGKGRIRQKPRIRTKRPEGGGSVGAVGN